MPEYEKINEDLKWLLEFCEIDDYEKFKDGLNPLNIVTCQIPKRILDPITKKTKTSNKERLFLSRSEMVRTAFFYMIPTLRKKVESEIQRSNNYYNPIKSLEKKDDLFKEQKVLKMKEETLIKVPYSDEIKI